jgi:DNA polymerase delta subunit 1
MHMHREHKLSSYSLNNVSLLYLQERKEDVHYSELSKLHAESNESRKRIAIYCLKDA